MDSMYSLDEIKALAANIALVRLTRRAIEGAFTEFGFHTSDICDVIMELTENDYVETVISRQTGRANDVYIKSIYSTAYKRTIKVYIKLEVFNNLIVISFHTAFLY